MSIRMHRFALAAAFGWMGFALAGASVATAEPLVTQGIGTASCAQLAGDLNPAEGLNNRVNLVLFAWVQGYVSAANIALLEDSGKHVDLARLDDASVIRLVQDFCKANPDKKPVAAIDALIRMSAKLKADWQQGTVDWEQ